MITISLDLERVPAAFAVRGGEPAGVDQVSLAMLKIPGRYRVKSPYLGTGKSGIGLTRSHSTTVTLPGGLWYLPINATVATALLSQKLITTWEPGAKEKALELATGLQKAQSVLQRLETHKELPGRPLLKHQQQALQAIELLGFRALLADDMGLGKTATTIGAYLLSELTRLLVVCPVSVKWNWRHELELMEIPADLVLVIDGAPRKRAEQLRNLKQGTPAPKAVVINYDLLAVLSKEQLSWLHEFAVGQFMALDESHYVKDRTAKRTQLVQGFKPKALVLLSGTPVRNTVADLFTQIQLLQPTWSNYWEFQDRYLQMGEIYLGRRKVMRSIGTKNIAELNGIVNTVQIRRMKEQVLDLPPKIRTVIELTLDETTAGIYKAMKEYWRYRFDQLDGSISIFEPEAKSALENALRLEQIAQGFIGGVPEDLVEKIGKQLAKGAVGIPGRPKELAFPSASKMTWLIDHVASLRATNRPVVIWSRFNAPIFYLQHELARATNYKGSVTLHGALSSEQKNAAIQEFQGGDYDVLLGQVKMAEGFNLTRATDVIFLGRDWSPAVNAQAEDRCHRIGQKGTVNIYIPIVRNSVEWYIHNRLQSKQASTDAALRSMCIEDLRIMMGDDDIV